MRPSNIPYAPDQAYKGKGWVDWGDWLGTGISRNFRSFEDAREFAHSLNFKRGKDWFKYTKSGKKPDDIPATPWSVYKGKGWTDSIDWLGNGRSIKFRSFGKAKKFVRSLKLRSQKEWRKYCKTGSKPVDVPNAPQCVYKNKGWKGYWDWLG